MVLAVDQYDTCQGSWKLKASRMALTVSVVLEVEELIIPLSHNPYCILHESANNEKASSCWYVSTASKPSNQICTPRRFPEQNSLFYRIRRSIQPVLNLVRLFPELFQWAWIIRCICPARSPKSIVLRAKVITRRAPYLSHGHCSSLM